MQRAKWFMARFVFSTAAIGTALSGGLLGYILCPLFSWYFFKDLNFTKYHQYITRLVLAFWRQIITLLNNPDYRKMFDIPWTAPPINAPDSKLVHISALWQHSGIGCGLCNNCCTGRACPLHDVQQNRCKSYGSFFWRYFNCGRYPENTKQIRYYECKKWELRDPC